ncbi:DDE-type integrase/transposase/recombinase [Streptomyces sp. HUAS TT20]|uniref:DDE-type integrase/transposase/recombinase n=1 Tax=Streptomyces sp. HUAS TT20 TaxID=3447509 RepID=UPI003985E0B2
MRGKKVITTIIPDPAAARSPDRLDRDFVAPAPDRTWVADFTHLAAWAGVVHVAFVVDTFSRRIVGWSESMSKETQLVVPGDPTRPGRTGHGLVAARPRRLPARFRQAGSPLGQ